MNQEKITKEKTVRKIKYSFPFQYDGNLFLFVLAFIVWFPIAFVLLFLNMSFLKDHATYRVEYHGRPFWLFFWAILFPPITLLLIVIKGFDLVEEMEVGG